MSSPSFSLHWTDAAGCLASGPAVTVQEFLTLAGQECQVSGQVLLPFLKVNFLPFKCLDLLYISELSRCFYACPINVSNVRSLGSQHVLSDATARNVRMNPLHLVSFVMTCRLNKIVKLKIAEHVSAASQLNKLGVGRGAYIEEPEGDWPLSKTKLRVFTVVEALLPCRLPNGVMTVLECAAFETAGMLLRQVAAKTESKVEPESLCLYDGTNRLCNMCLVVMNGHDERAAPWCARKRTFRNFLLSAAVSGELPLLLLSADGEPTVVHCTANTTVPELYSAVGRAGAVLFCVDLRRELVGEANLASLGMTPWDRIQILGEPALLPVQVASSDYRRQATVLLNTSATVRSALSKVSELGWPDLGVFALTDGQSFWRYLSTEDDSTVISSMDLRQNRAIVCFPHDYTMSITCKVFMGAQVRLCVPLGCTVKQLYTLASVATGLPVARFRLRTRCETINRYSNRSVLELGVWDESELTIVSEARQITVKFHVDSRSNMVTTCQARSPEEINRLVAEFTNVDV